MAWWERAKVGDDVVLICAPNVSDWHFYPDDASQMIVGKVYKITEIYRSKTNIFYGNDVHVRVTGIRRGITVAAFKPVERPHKGMEILRGLLTGSGPWGQPLAPDAPSMPDVEPQREPADA